MHKKIFPKEIITFTQENHYCRYSQPSKFFYPALVMVSFALIALLPLIRVDITVQSRGIICSMTEPTLLQSPVSGLVREIRIAENMKIREGDTLLSLSPEKIDDQLRLMNNRIESYISHIHDLKCLVKDKGQPISSGLMKSSYAEYNQKLNEYQIAIEGISKEFQRSKTLFEKGVIPVSEYEKKDMEFQQIIKERDSYSIQKIAGWHAQLFQFETELRNLIDNRNQLKVDKSYYTIIAPSSGSISNFSGIKKGSFILPNQPIATISSSDSLVAECYVSPVDIGYLRKGNPANFRIDAYNFYQWGLASGKIIDISNHLYQTEKADYFKVRCQLDQDHLELKSGYRGELRNGLTITSQFLVARRSLFDLLFDKAEDWLNPRKVKETN